jgi:parallel beta-helix repeat protein
MNVRSRCLFALAAASACGAACVLTFAGPLDPPVGPVAPTYKTLAQVEPRTDVATLPGVPNGRHLINLPGSYYLSANVIGASGLSGIIINASNVTLDLNGFGVVGAAGSIDGIQVGATRTNVSIRNGTVRGWVGDGIDAADDSNVQISGVNVSSNSGDGIVTGPNSVVLSCTSAENDGDGFQLGEGCTIQQSTARLNAGAGINVPGTGSGGAPGTGGATVQGCATYRNGGNGIQGAHTAVIACTTSYNGLNGIQLNNSSVFDCEARGNTVNGFAGAGIIFSRCKTRSNGADGFNVGEGTIIDACLSRGNNGDGIECDKEVTVKFCHLEDNNIDGGGGDAGIRIVQNDCRIEGNTLVNNLGTGVLAAAGATGNVVISNRATGNSGGNYSIVAGNMVGTVVATEAAMNAAGNALINISY